MRTRNLIAIIFLLSTSLVYAEEIKIGVVDMARVLNEVDEGLAAKDELKRKVESRQKILNDKQDKAKALQEQLTNQSSMALKPEAKQAKAAELQKMVAEVQQLYMTMEQETAKEQQEAMESIVGKMNGVFNQIGKEGDYTLLLNKNQTAVLYAKPGMDLTEDVIRRYNASHKVKKAASKPKKK